MAKGPDLKRYELFGWEYPLVCPLTEQEVSWHELWARRTGGPLLGLACGTGRLLCRLAAAGFDVVGLDICDAMLHLAERFAAELPDDSRQRLRFVNGNMADFDLGRQFGLIFIADNSFRELKAREDLRSCLECIRRHLAPGGVVLITERRFDPSEYPGGRRSLGWSEPRRHPQTGELVSRRIEMQLAPDHRSLRGNMIYRIAHADGSETIEQCPFDGLILHVPQYVELFDEAGLETRVCAGYRETDDDGADPILCFVCRAKQRAAEQSP